LTPKIIETVGLSIVNGTVKIVLIRLNRWFAGWETQYSIRELEEIIRRQEIAPVLSEVVRLSRPKTGLI